ncbi:MAG: lysine/arginine/ornithine ABC transporter substrate-binding protein [Geminicoccaceae bacterium]|nr:transporter substrate-binding domain-containing protein [Geminicoccaceae bacterium]
MKKILVASALAALVSGAAQAADLRICVEGAYPPFSATSPSGELIGFDIDITNALCDEMGKECELVQTEWDGIIPALLERKCDAIIASMSITEERRKTIDFTDKYYQTPAVFVAAEGAGIPDTAEGLADKVVGVQRGTIHHDYMTGEFPDVELRLYGTQEEANLDLQAGRVDAVLADSVTLDDGFLKTPAGEGFAIFGEPRTDETYFGVGAGIGVRKEDTELRDALSAAIAAIRENGVYDEISSGYFDFDVYGD